MKQRIVMKVQMSGDKSRSKALGLVARTHGVQSVAIEGRERNHLVVVGDGLDAVSLTSYLRKKVGSAQIVQVDVVGGGGGEKLATTTAAGPQQQWQPARYSSYYSRPAAVHSYYSRPAAAHSYYSRPAAAHSYYSRPAAEHPYGGQYCYDDTRPGADSSCAIM